MREQVIGQEDSKQGFELNLEKAWQCIEQLLPSEKDKLLAELTNSLVYEV